MKGCFVTFEGADGAGKTTQIKLLYEFLREQGHNVLLTREPGGTGISDSIRALLLDPKNSEMRHQTEVLLYAASRAQHVREKIIPALEEGKIVLCDRFVDASLAYQGYGLGLPLEEIININQFATGGLTPDITYFLDLPAEISRERLKQRFAAYKGPDRIESKPAEYHQKVRQGFAEICRKYADRIVKINAARSIETIQKEVRDHFLHYLTNRQ
ncbi:MULTISPECIES: dTMP kinase [Aneurinibacillus]|uniref:Thymidylate kinase n=1 Tax=Aneurinibacillus thermoaerophilus TaxID=143495 RepID=A0A1G8DP63_ANETH|nr:MULTISPECIES: dTMP kinase [Aneurinibacillus]AMA74541.1 thymidylate kinase [Aneurinibacillus sp. XH2]MED0675166.1 dTMP kinase [Aneurinibacillus thermoaerophilus]MED0681224.1 dTMP kinase [Aneurinibacillus thermoaerophilus]MED0738851.1 dTMP kinase [Aneurinibacillus thermoaerophilus]MED0757701.1 dTMP kinase [Aneurinibacillus thermoaerophilus]